MANARANTQINLALTIIRLVVGWAFMVHGSQKVFEWGISGTSDSFEAMGVPLASVVGPVVAYLELVGGAALILGLFTRIIGALLVVDMAGAAFTVHLEQGFFSTDGGYELVLLLGAGALALAIAGAGSWSADRVLLRRK
ncbi:MAG: DoxX family protein [Galactobacter sp.]|uniref:DoxX family protein n=1 Tax=Galactobacter sp. TaxID=2676125 RepID=UPI0025BAFCDC|nr:DoxX family protein [Galactobacter sp.]